MSTDYLKLARGLIWTIMKFTLRYKKFQSQLLSRIIVGLKLRMRNMRREKLMLWRNQRDLRWSWCQSDMIRMLLIMKIIIEHKLQFLQMTRRAVLTVNLLALVYPITQWRPKSQYSNNWVKRSKILWNEVLTSKLRLHRKRCWDILLLIKVESLC